jgi:hypothetical protein
MEITRGQQSHCCWTSSPGSVGRGEERSEEEARKSEEERGGARRRRYRGERRIADVSMRRRRPGSLEEARDSDSESRGLGSMEV